MVKDSSNTGTVKETAGRRKNSNNQERRSSVSEITDFFNKSEKGKDKMSSKIKTRNASKSKDKGSNGEQETSKNQPEITHEARGNSPDNTDNLTEQDNPLNHEYEHEHEEIAKTSEAEISLNNASTQTSDDAILAALKELQEKIVKVEEDIHQPKNGISDQLAKTSEKVSDIYTDIHGAVNGILVRMDHISNLATTNSNKITQMELTQDRITKMLNDSKKLMNDLQTMQGLVQKVTQQLHHTAYQVLDLTKRGMEQHIIVHGVDNSLELSDPKLDTPHFSARERCKHAFLDFCKQVMNIDLDIDDIWKAHRTGPYKEGKVRPMVIKLSYSANDLVMEKMGVLKGKKNPKTQQVYFISEQVLDGITETKKQVSSRAKHLKDLNNQKSPERRQKIQVFNDKILVDGELSLPEIMPPQPSQLFLNPESQRKVDCVQAKIMETEPITIKGSKFIGLAVKVHSLEEMEDAYIAAAQRYPSADHIMTAYAFKNKNNSKLHHGACDNREYGASIKIKNIFEQKAKNTAIFVVREYGGVHLGIDRFRTIQKVALDALDLLLQ